MNSHLNKIGYLLFLNLSIISGILIALNLFGIIDTKFIASNNTFSAFLIIFLTGMIFCKYNLDEHYHRYNSFARSIVDSSQYFFISLLILIAANQFLKLDILSNRILMLTATAIGFGFLTFYKNRDGVEKEIEEEKQKEEDEEKQRYHDFEYKFQNINRIPILRNIVRWMYKEGWFYSVGLILIFLIGIILYSHNLGEQYMWTDEVYSFISAQMIIEKGIPLFDSGFLYNSALFYHYLLAAVIFIFGSEQFYGRFINIFFNIGTSLLIYYFLKRENKKVAIFGVILFLIMNITLAMSRETRMYSTFSFLFLALISLFYFLDNKLENSKIRDNYLLIITFLTIGYLTYQTNGLVVTLIFGAMLFYIASIVKYGLNPKKLIFLVITVAFIFLGAIIMYGTVNVKEAYFDKTTLDWAKNKEIKSDYYLNILDKNYLLYLLVLPLSIITFLSTRNKKYNLVFCVLFAGLILISYQRQLQERYLYFLMPSLIIVTCFALINFFKVFSKNKQIKIISLLFIALLVFFQFSLFFKEIGEIDTFTQDSISKHKKYEFNKVINFTKNIDYNEYLIFGDWHSSSTLYSQGIVVDYILLPAGDIRANTNDPYFNIKYIEYESKEYSEIIRNDKVLLILRDPHHFDLEDTPLKNLGVANIPAIYSNT